MQTGRENTKIKKVSLFQSYNIGEYGKENTKKIGSPSLFGAIPIDHVGQFCALGICDPRLS